ncbi:transposase [Bradyrhizobium sp. USDA 4532]|uniref:transposase n=1 Tax=unclassified Bradyrhizobium TaxID=2631580 RepID=UPI0035C6EF5F
MAGYSGRCGRRRRWSDEVKGRIVAESYAPGAIVSGVARRPVSRRNIFSCGVRQRVPACSACRSRRCMFRGIVSTDFRGS